jgi:AmiR/NasT family two-component response regulator
MPTTSNRFSRRAPIEEATGVLVGFLHCGEADALALLRAQSHASHVEVAQVARGVVEADSRQRQWLWGAERRLAQPLTERCA